MRRWRHWLTPCLTSNKSSRKKTYRGVNLPLFFDNHTLDKRIIHDSLIRIRKVTGWQAKVRGIGALLAPESVPVRRFSGRFQLIYGQSAYR